MIFVVSGPGGVGKGTLVDELVGRDPRLWLSRSWTTRARREHEADDAYVFVTDEEFDKHDAANGFLEWVNFLGSRYGTPKPNAPSGVDVLLEIELQGAQLVRNLDPSAVLILVVPPSLEVQRARLRARGDTEERIAERVAFGEREMETGRRVANEIVVNDDLETAVKSLAAIIDDYRVRRS